jgi:RNA polymerase sigma-70 factor, ECF subfamily
MADSREAIFTEHRPQLFSIAYRMLGSAADTEDIVQDCYLRWRNVGDADVQSPRQYLTSIVTHLCINHLQSARVRREQYIGPWLPEPVVTRSLADPVELAESLTMAFLVMLESLSPVERAVFLLSEVFDYSMDETAAMVDKTPANCRQILHRARQAVAQRKQRYVVPDDSAEAVLKRFEEAIRAGNIQELMNVLDQDVVLYGDGGGKVQAALKPVRGATNVAKFFVGIAKKGALDGIVPVFVELNRQPALINYVDGLVRNAVVFDMAEGRIRGIYSVANPEKLEALNKENQS